MNFIKVVMDTWKRSRTEHGGQKQERDWWWRLNGEIQDDSEEMRQLIEKNRELDRQREEDLRRRQEYYATCEEITEIRIEGFMEPTPDLRPCDIQITVPENAMYEIKPLGYKDGLDIRWSMPEYYRSMREDENFPAADVDTGRSVCVDVEGKKCEDGFHLYGRETYHLHVTLKAKQGYVFADRVKLYVNSELVDSAPKAIVHSPRYHYHFKGFEVWRFIETEKDEIMVNWTTAHVCVIDY